MRQRVAALSLVLCACGGKAPSSNTTTAPTPYLINEIFSPPGAGASLDVCSVDLVSCSPASPGPITRVPGALRVSPRGHATMSRNGASFWLGGNSSLVVRDESAPIELQRGDIQINTTQQSIAILAGGTKLELGPGSIAVLEATDTNLAAITVRRGTAIGQGVKLAAGDSAKLSAGTPPDANAAQRGQQAPIAMDLVLPPATPSDSQPAPTRGFGTLSARIPGTKDVVPGVRLVRHEVHATVKDGFAHTEVEEEFANDTDRVLEGRYVFPVPPEASVSRLALWVGDKLMEGEVVEKKRAASIFNAIVEDTVRPRDPALLEWVKGSEFSLKIFPIPAHGSRKVILGYDHALSMIGGEGRYVYPLSLGADQANKIDRLKINVDVEDLAPIESASVSGYEAKITGEGTKKSFSYEASDVVPQGDFSVRFSHRTNATANVSYAPATKDEPADAPGYIAVRANVSLPPDIEVKRTRASRAFVLDVSRSQSTETLAGQVKLVSSMLHELDEDEKYVLLACDSACSTYPDKGTQHGAASIEAASKWLSSLTPSGASDLAGALIAGIRSLSSEEIANDPAQVIFLSDGSASTGELTVDAMVNHVQPVLAKRHADVRMLGAGRTVDELTLGSLATRLGATYDRVSNGDSLEKRAIDLALSLRAPTIREPKVSLPEGATLVYPTELPTLRVGQEIQLVARAAASMNGEVEIKGTINDAPYVVKQRLASIDTSRRNDLVPRLWAEARIRAIETNASTATNPTELIKLSQRFKIMSRATSFLTLESEAMYAEFGIARPGAPPADRSAGVGNGAPTMLAPINAPPTIGESFGMLDSFGSSGVSDKGGLAGAVAADAGGKGGAGMGFGMPGEHKVAGPSGRVSGSSRVSSGSLPTAPRVMASVKTRARACYQRALNANPVEAGRAQFRLDIDANGAVKNTRVTVSGLSGGVQSCLQSVLSRLSFQQPESPTAVVEGSYTFDTDGDTPGGLAMGTRMPSAPKPTTTATHNAGSERWRSDGENDLAKLRKASSESPALRKAREALIRGLLIRGRFEEAMKEADSFAQNDPDYSPALELVAYGAAAVGDGKKALASVDALVENDPTNRAAHLRAAQALEASGEETRACSHWRSAASLAAPSDDITAESLRCRARVLGERDQVKAEIALLTKAGPKVKKLAEQLDGEIPRYEPGASPGALEAQVTCESEPCPDVAIVSPSGTIFSKWTPSAARATQRSISVSSTGAGMYRTVLVKNAVRSGTVKLRAFGAERVFAFTKDSSPTLVETVVSEPDWTLYFGSATWGLQGFACSCTLR
ncbi:MAG: VIT domain-containing protein [Polyangiaceae bacterium]